MEKSIVYVSMKDNNDLDCSYSIVQKDEAKVVIILKDSECGIFDYDELVNQNLFHYLLLKHYPDDGSAYKDFLKLTGKMCKKSKFGKYFLNHIEEDNRMVFIDMKNEHMITEEERNLYNDRFEVFQKFVKEKANLFKID